MSSFFETLSSTVPVLYWVQSKREHVLALSVRVTAFRLLHPGGES